MDQCLKKLGTVYQGCEAEISELVYQIEKMLNEKQLEWEVSYNILSDENNELLEIITSNKIELKEKDIEIHDLRKEIMVIEKSNYEKRILLESKISGLSHANSSVEFCLNCKAKSSPRKSTDINDVKIATLKKECNHYQDKIAELEILQTTHNAQIKLLEEQRSTILKKNEDLKQKFSNCRKEYHSKLKTTDNEIKLFLNQKDHYEVTISNLKDDLTKKDGEIKNMKNTLEDVLSSNHKNNTLFSNMKTNYDSLKEDKELLINESNGLVNKIHELEKEKEQILKKVSVITKDAESADNYVKNEVELIKAQLEIYQKENNFLRTFLIQQDRTSNSGPHCPADLEKLEADNHSLKENICNMEKEIAGILKITEQSIHPEKMQSPSSTKAEVIQVKEMYEQHLENMKAEVEQLRLANLSLKVMHQNCDHHNCLNVSDLESNKDSLILDHKFTDCLTELDNGKTKKSLHCTSPSLSIIKNIDDKQKSFIINDATCTEMSNPLTDEFAELQKSVLKKFEAKLNECVSNFNNDTV